MKYRTENRSHSKTHLTLTSVISPCYKNRKNVYHAHDVAGLIKTRLLLCSERFCTTKKYRKTTFVESNYDSVSFLHSFFWDFTEIFWRWYLNDNTLTIFELQKQAEVDILQHHWKHFCGTLVTYHRQMTLEYWQIRQKQWTSSQIHPFL